MPDPHSNFGYSTVATAPSPASSGTSLVVQAADGAKFPSTGAFNATVWPVSTQPTSANAEIVRVTAISTDTFTITRAQESTSARTIVVGDQIAATVTAKTLTDVELDRSYLTSVDQSVSANTQAIYDDYLELAASFVYELAADAELVVGSYATPLPLPDQNTNIFISVADETIPRNNEVVFSDFYELSAPFATEIATNGEMQVGTGPDIPAFPVGYEIGYDQITTSAAIASTTESSPTTVIACMPHVFDGTAVLLQVFIPQLSTPGVLSGFSVVTLFEGATQIGRLGIALTPAAVAMQITYFSEYRFTPTAGTHTYTIGAFASSTSGGPGFTSGAGGVGTSLPAFARFTKV